MATRTDLWALMPYVFVAAPLRAAVAAAAVARVAVETVGRAAMSAARVRPNDACAQCGLLILSGARRHPPPVLRSTRRGGGGYPAPGPVSPVSAFLARSISRLSHPFAAAIFFSPLSRLNGLVLVSPTRPLPPYFFFLSFFLTLFLSLRFLYSSSVVVVVAAAAVANATVLSGYDSGGAMDHGGGGGGEGSGGEGKGSDGGGGCRAAFSVVHACLFRRLFGARVPPGGAAESSGKHHGHVRSGSRRPRFIRKSE
ncbi:Hypothetical protein CINCED_3A000511 [Cinara cedri]|uniref:Uncharacterized protein n=1 Tax=Cinara cedri TaxID=506608 RepID=A0A5E4MZP2_9HEMI|nr:Hypothetical protein CINCED_3A000511 [Cinara cedri]